MTDISSHPLLQQAYGVCQAIEQCGASPELTRAVGRASDLLRALDDHLKRGSGSVPGQNAGIASDSVAECRLRDDQEARDEWWRRELSMGVFTVPREQAQPVDSSAAPLREDLTRCDQTTSFIHAWDRDSSGRPRKFSDAAKAAMRLVESLISAGDIALAPDRWHEGRMRFTGAPLRDIDKPDEQVSTATPIQGEAMSFMLDPLERTIESTTRVMREELDHMADISRSLQGNVPTTTIYKRMGDHLDALLAAQLKRVTSNDNA